MQDLFKELFDKEPTINSAWMFEYDNQFVIYVDICNSSSAIPTLTTTLDLEEALKLIIKKDIILTTRRALEKSGIIVLKKELLYKKQIHA